MTIEIVYLWGKRKMNFISFGGFGLHEVDAYGQLNIPAVVASGNQVIGTEFVPMTQWLQTSNSVNCDRIDAVIEGSIPNSGCVDVRGPGMFLVTAHAFYRGDNNTRYTMAVFQNGINVGEFSEIKAIQTDVNVSFTSIVKLPLNQMSRYDVRIKADKASSNLAMRGGAFIVMRMSQNLAVT